MSELINKNAAGRDLRWQLLSTVSALTLLATLSARDAKADQSSTPTVWIELGGQLQRQSGQGDPFDPPFVANNPDSSGFRPVSPLKTEKAPLYSNGAEAKITFQPEGTDWVFSAGIQYGRAGGRKNTLQQPNPNVHVTQIVPYNKCISSYPYTCHRYLKTTPETLSRGNFSSVQAVQRQSQAVVDFQAGKDVGLGLFGGESTAALSIGIRFAQFVSRSSSTMRAVPDWQHFNDAYRYTKFFPTPGLYFINSKHHSNFAEFHATRSFHGIGPSISVNGSAPFAGVPEKGELAVDWGVNAALLFGRQRASGIHQISGRYDHFGYHSTYNITADFSRAKAVTVPNIGGFAGISFLYADAKVSFGYRGDFFFGAMDAGNDTRKTETVGFYGPFASISIGLGG